VPVPIRPGPIGTIASLREKMRRARRKRHFVTRKAAETSCIVNLPRGNLSGKYYLITIGYRRCRTGFCNPREHGGVTANLAVFASAFAALIRAVRGARHPKQSAR
jgi:hypothetical protein